jgi:hypothetical protein
VHPQKTQFCLNYREEVVRISKSPYRVAQKIAYFYIQVSAKKAASIRSLITPNKKPPALVIHCRALLFISEKIKLIS